MALALALNGFFLYLGGLRVIGRAPHTATTGVWYGLMGLLCLGGVWLERETLLRRLRRRALPETTYVVAGVALALWFLLNVLLLSHGSLSRTLAAQLVLWTLPAALLALALPRESMPWLAAGLAALGCAYIVIEAGALVHHLHASRFSPIAHLDPISAAQFPAVGAIALLALTPRTVWEEIGRAVALPLLCAGAILPGSRGPLIALGGGALAAGALLPRRTALLLLPAVVAGIALGYGGSREIGSSDYLTSTNVPISTFHIRREWWSAAAEAIPDAPVFGHGVAMFVDNTPEAKQMGVAGTRTYPHNSPLESLYSLGALGALPYIALIGSGITALVLLVRRRARRPIVLATGLYVFAFASANLSGEIGADATLWAAGALAVGLYADSRGGSRTSAVESAY
ncbi:MAG TPA: O-antigen ligase family protein [Gaiellaceae bacterium]|nr:O-antigen ligase family protein [Gaiellaceae bacterium]